MRWVRTLSFNVYGVHEIVLLKFIELLCIHVRLLSFIFAHVFFSKPISVIINIKVLPFCTFVFVEVFFYTYFEEEVKKKTMFATTKVTWKWLKYHQVSIANMYNVTPFPVALVIHAKLTSNSTNISEKIKKQYRATF